MLNAIAAPVVTSQIKGHRGSSSPFCRGHAVIIVCCVEHMFVVSVVLMGVELRLAC